MNREIKFRAFVRGYMVEVVSIDFVNKYITWDDNQYDRCDPPNKCFEIESFENIKLLQYTGLKDKNGKEIYEGDIISRQRPQGLDKTKAIKWHAYVATGFNISKTSDNRVITGNIYENPELLDTKKAQLSEPKVE